MAAAHRLTPALWQFRATLLREKGPLIPLSDPGRTASEEWWVAGSETAVTLPWANSEGRQGSPWPPGRGREGEREGGMSNRQTQGQRQMCARIDEEINHRLSEPEAFAFLKWSCTGGGIRRPLHA